MRNVSELAQLRVSSCKSPHKASFLTDGSLKTFWQSDGPQPHHITVSFPFRVQVASVKLYVDFKEDESYTPSKIAVSAGTSPSDLIEITSNEFNEPSGWLELETLDEAGQPITANFIQVAIIANHQNGKDTHVRLLKIMSPQTNNGLLTDEPHDFISPQFTYTIR